MWIDEISYSYKTSFVFSFLKNEENIPFSETDRISECY